MDDQNIKEILERCYHSKSINKDNQIFYQIEEESLDYIYNLLLLTQDYINEQEKEIESYKKTCGWLFIGLVLLFGLLVGALIL